MIFKNHYSTQTTQLKFELQRKVDTMGAVCSEELDPTGQTTEETPGADTVLDERSEEWKSDLLQNVDKIFLGRFPGRMIVFGKHAEPGKNTREVKHSAESVRHKIKHIFLL